MLQPTVRLKQTRATFLGRFLFQLPAFQKDWRPRLGIPKHLMLQKETGPQQYRISGM